LIYAQQKSIIPGKVQIKKWRGDMVISTMRLERLKKGKTQIDLWQKTGIPQWRISLIERGIIPTPVEREKIAKALGVPEAELFTSLNT
jgi:transcriptional regulator with XRE-family HTH domain